MNEKAIEVGERMASKEHDEKCQRPSRVRIN
jgi:hypothetical protein